MTAPMNTTFDIRLTDTTLRDGSHAMSHRFTEDPAPGTGHDP
ncbi:hypothetical protein [Arthrobacter sp. MA-N2]|nr:hypothetical protein [Arthrobacter sp. MA-N2]